MRLVLPASLLITAVALAQPAPQAQPNPLAAFVRENYTKYEFRIPMRDGARLFTAVYVPKDAITEGKTYPILMVRTPYSVGPYGVDQYPERLGPSEQFTRERFIFVNQDVRGRYLSEGTYDEVRGHRPGKGPREIDESSDTYDTIEWLIHNIKSNNGKVGLWGISQPGFYVLAGMVDAHPALVAASPQAPVTDYYLGDDLYHNGAFMLAANFGFYRFFRRRGDEPEPPAPFTPLDFGTPDGYRFYLDLGPLENVDEKYFHRQNPYWTHGVENTTYNQFWETRSIWKHLKSIKPAVLTVGGWFDAEDLQGPLRVFDSIEKNNPPATNVLVMGPWTHGGFSRGDGDRVGNARFDVKSGPYYREHIEFPFFLAQLKGKAAAFPKAWLFETGTNVWRKYDAWPPKEAQTRSMFLSASGQLSWQRPDKSAFDEYISDPNKPVPYIGSIQQGMRFDYMTEDQRFASTRPDVLVYQTEPLDGDVTIAGPITADLKVSTSGTDSDFVVKIIDVYPNDYPDRTAPAPGGPRGGEANAVKMAGYQQLVRGEPFRGKYRKGFEKGVAFEPGKPDRITFRLPDVDHTFRRGHRIMVQIQSSWFPLTDRNPQKFLDIPRAHREDFVKATQRVYTGGGDGSRIEFFVLP